jgi:hypothetical protein
VRHPRLVHGQLAVADLLVNKGVLVGEAVIHLGPARMALLPWRLGHRATGNAGAEESKRDSCKPGFHRHRRRARWRAERGRDLIEGLLQIRVDYLNAYLMPVGVPAPADRRPLSC